MKRTILLLTLLALVCSSCWKTEEIEGTEIHTAIKIYKSWRSTTENVIDVPVRYAFICNAWANGNDSVRRAVEDEFLPYIRLRDEGNNEYGYYYGTDLFMTINTGGTALDATEAQWLITVYGDYSRYEPEPAFLSSESLSRLSIKHLGASQWNIVLDSATCEGSTSDWTLTVPDTEIPTDLCATRFALEGNGEYRHFSYFYNGPVTITYSITKPLRNHGAASSTRFDAGTVNMTVTKREWNDLNVTAEILNNTQTRITYRGVTKTWDE